MIRTRNLSMKMACLLFLGLNAAGLASAQQAAPGASHKPKIHREDIEWLDVWVADTQVTNLPRVLLIGDSITRGYHPDAEKALHGHAVVARLATSKCAGDPALVEEVSMLLRQYHFDAIHFNNGNHGLGYYSDAVYVHGLRNLIAAFHKYAPGAELIWATTTPIREENHLEHITAENAGVIQRNSISVALMKQLGIPTDDLYNLVLAHPEYYRPDGTHFNEKGTEIEGAEVARRVIELLPQPAK